jgi:hypothetical protein
MSEPHRHEEFDEAEGVDDGFWWIDAWGPEKEDLEVYRPPSPSSLSFYPRYYDPYCDFRVHLADDISEEAVKISLKALMAWVDDGGLEAIRCQR